MKRLLCITAIVLGAASLQAGDHVTPRVIGGTIPAAGELESIALLVAKGDLTVGGQTVENQILGLCTSTLISPTTLLTAAHCVNQQILQTAIERAPSSDGRRAKLRGQVRFEVAFVRGIEEVELDPSLLLPVERTEEHQEFAILKRPWVAFQANPNRWDDIALVYLEEPVIDRSIQLLATPDQLDRDEQLADTQRRFAGYGIAVEGDPSTAGILREGYAGLGKFSRNEFISGVGGNQHACQGDSGGPIFLSAAAEYQIGIASRVNKRLGLGDIWDGISGGAKAPSCTLGLVYTRVDTYLDWIEDRVPDFGQIL